MSAEQITAAARARLETMGYSCTITPAGAWLVADAVPGFVAVRRGAMQPCHVDVGRTEWRVASRGSCALGSVRADTVDQIVDHVRTMLPEPIVVGDRARWGLEAAAR